MKSQKIDIIVGDVDAKIENWECETVFMFVLGNCNECNEGCIQVRAKTIQS